MKKRSPKEGEGQRATSGETTVVRGVATEPRLPHERDESASSQEQGLGVPPQAGRQEAFDDAQRERPDTGPSPVMDTVYERQKKP